MLKPLFEAILKKILWRLAKPISKLLFLCHSISYKNPFGKKPLARSVKEYEKNFSKSVEIKNHPISSHKLFLKHKPDIAFIEKLAFTLQNVLKNTKNSYIHGYVLYIYLAEYIDNYLNNEGSKCDSLNIVDIGTARGFSSLCLAKVLNNKNINGKIFTFDILPNRSTFFWNAYTDISKGPLSRIDLLNPWKELVNKYLIFFGTATFNSLKVVDIPNINFAFVDGSHFFKDVMWEIDYLIKRLNKKSIIIFDDYDEELFTGVVKACNYLSSLKMHSSFELIPIQNKRKLAIFIFN